MAESHLDFTRPSHVLGRYALYGRLAAGGMATVHLGRVMEADGSARTVAVKRLHPQFCKDPEFVAMFIDEARLAARIKHPNVVETLDILTMGQELLLVMEYIRGECFSKLLRAARRKSLEPSLGVVGRIASGMLHGLHAAHEATDDRGEPLNVVHRDVSPQNVMIDASGNVKVLDFGVAKASARIQITRDGQMKGKLSYMSPEQLQGMPVDRRADVFACGVVLWEALTRRRLFVGEDASEVLRKILRDEVPPPSEWVPGLSPEIDQVVLRALSKDPERRYQTALELALDVERIVELAPHSEVGAWLESVAGEIMGKRERLLAEIERSGPSELSFAADAASLAAQGSLTESDTFQRIQSWAEREAARVAGDSHPPLPSQSRDAEPARSADARCAPSEPPLAAGGGSAGVARELEPGARLDADEPESAVTLAEEPSLGATTGADEARAPAPVGAQPAASTQSAFAQGAIGLIESSRRTGRFIAGLAAAAVLLGLTGIAVIGVQPSLLMRASGALLPEKGVSGGEREKGSPGASASSPRAIEPTTPPDEPTGPAPASADPDPAASGVASGAPAADDALLGEGADGVDSSTLEPSASGAELTVGPVAPASQREPVAEQAAASSAASSKTSTARPPAAAKQRPAAPAGKRAGRRTATTRRRAAPPPKPAKVDCRQPYWIDEGGIRRIKLACL